MRLPAGLCSNLKLCNFLTKRCLRGFWFTGGYVTEEVPDCKRKVGRLDIRLCQNSRLVADAAQTMHAC